MNEEKQVYDRSTLVQQKAKLYLEFLLMIDDEFTESDKVLLYVLANDPDIQKILREHSGK